MEISRYRDGEVSVGKAGGIADLSLWQFLDELDDRGIGVNYSEADLEADIAAVEDE